MNERIKLLASKCFELPRRPESSIYFDKEKFAKLIIEECIATVQKRYMGDNNREDMEVLRCVADMKKHFGVEE